MGSRTFNLGQDCSVQFQVISGPTGFQNTVYSFSTIGGDLMRFEADPLNEIIRRTPISNKGRSRRRVEYHGWGGTIEVGRINADFELLEIIQAQNYRNGGDPYLFTINETILNRDGSGTSSFYQYTNCIITLSKGGVYQIGSDVIMTMNWEGDDATALS